MKPLPEGYVQDSLAGSRRNRADLDSADIIEAFSVASGNGGDDDKVEVAEDEAAAEWTCTIPLIFTCCPGCACAAGTTTPSPPIPVSMPAAVVVVVVVVVGSSIVRE